MSTSVASVVSHFPEAENGFTTTTSGSVSSGATTVGLNSVAGYTNGEPAVFVIDPLNASKQTFTGIIDTSGVQVTNVVWTAGSNTTHASGATVVDYATATHISMMSKGIKVEHKQDGTHSDITADTIVVADAGTLEVDTINEATAANGVTVDGMSIKDGAVVGASGKGVLNSSLGTGAGELGAAWQSYTPTWAGATVGNGTVVAKYQQIGKTIRYRIVFTLGSTSSVTTADHTLPVTAHSDYSAVETVIGGSHVDDATSSTTGQVPGVLIIRESTTVARPAVLYTDSAAARRVAYSGTIPITWATNDVITMQGEYEAA